MKKTCFLALIFAISALTKTFAQQISGSSIFSPSAGGARILSGQGNTATNPAIGFQGSSSSTTTTAQNDNGGGLGIFRPAANTMGFSTAGLERFRVTSSGAFGLNTTTPRQLLHVNDGHLLLTGKINGWGTSGVIWGDTVNTLNSLGGFAQWGAAYELGGLNFYKPWNSTNSGGSQGFGNCFLFLKDDGKVGMGVDPRTTSAAMPTGFPTGYSLYVKGKILTEGIKCAIYNTSNWADYVFADDYKLKPLKEVEEFVKENKHLPNVPSAQQIVNNGGIEMTEMFAKQMEKIEELTLYLIEQNKKVEEQAKQIETLKLKIENLEAKVAE